MDISDVSAGLYDIGGFFNETLEERVVFQCP